MIRPPLSDIRTFLRGVVAAHPAEPCLVTTDGLELTYQGFDEWVNRAANLIADRGISKGDAVALILPNCPEYLYLWFGLAKIGAVHVAINTRLIGESLRYQIDKAESSLVVVHRELANAYHQACNGLASVREVLVLNEDDRSGLGAELAASNPWDPPAVDIGPGDPLVMMYTSGTTGRPKAVVNPHNAYVRSGHDLARLMALHSDDRMYVFMPLFHGNPQMMGVMPILAAGGSIALSRRFSASHFWDEVRSMGASVFTHIGSPLPILMKQPPNPDDADNPIRLILGGAPAETALAFGERFSCAVLDGWGMIEAGCNTTITPADRVVPGTNGVPRECFDVRVFDDEDRELPKGEVGQIVVRPTEPHVMFSGYHRDPDRTLASMRNQWFHTGDLGRVDDDGNLYFLGRSTDAIRRKGENISAIEIENILNAHPLVDEAAVVGVPDGIAGQEIAGCVVPIEATELTPEALVDWCSSRLADFMIPRFIRVMDRFPRTESHKVQKFKLRDLGTEGAWDRLADQEHQRRKDA